MDEIGGLLEPAIDAGETHVSHLVNLAQAVHDQLADDLRGYFAFVLVGGFVDDSLGQVLDDLVADRAFLAGFLDAGQEFFPSQLFAAAIAFKHHQSRALDLLVSCESKGASATLAAAANGGPLARGARVNDLVILTAALWASHSEIATANSVWLSLAYKQLESQGVRRAGLRIGGYVVGLRA